MASFLFPDQGSRPLARPVALSPYPDPSILYFWNAFGWCKGTIAKTNKDGRKTVPGGGKANFIVYYELDDEEVKHFLSLDSYGIDDRWVLLEPAA